MNYKLKERFLNLSLKWRLIVLICAAAVTVAPVIIKAYCAVSQEEYDIGHVSDFVPTSFLFFPRFTNVSYNVYSVNLRVNRALVFVSLISFLPLCILVLFVISRRGQVFLKYGMDLFRLYKRWAHKDKADIVELFEGIGVEYVENMLKFTLALLEKEKELECVKLRLERVSAQLSSVKQQQHRRTRQQPPPPQIQDPKTSLYEKRFNDMQKRHTDLMRRYYSLDKKYNELAKKCREEDKKKQSELQTTSKHRATLQGDATLCIICMEKKRQYLLKPCNHYCVCNGCKHTLKNKCPICRKHIQKYEKLFIA